MHKPVRVMQGRVKSVLSGDTLIVIGQPCGGPPPEKQITLSYVMAPRLGRGDRADEAFAWQSREFLRERCIGQYVAFTPDGPPSRSPQQGEVRRDFCTVTLGGQNLAHMAIAAGWVKVKEITNRKYRTPEYEEMVRMEQEAKEQGVGMWTSDAQAKAASVREIRTIQPDDARAFVDSLRGEPQEGIVEFVPNGSTFRIMLVPSFTQIQLILAGIQAPSFRRDQAGSDPLPFAEEAKYFTESRLMNRNVHVKLFGVDRYGNFLGRVLVQQGDITHELLRAGLAKLAPWSAQTLPHPEQALIRDLEGQAKKARLRLWATYEPEAETTQVEREFQATVVEVISGDTLQIVESKEGGEGEEMRVSLSSIRAPRLPMRRDERNLGEPYAWEAREMLRSLVIGRKVKVIAEYKRPIPPPNGPLRQYATLFVGKTNVAEKLVSEGLVSVIRHRIEDDRSTQYQALLDAELQAKQMNRNVHRIAQLRQRAEKSGATIDDPMFGAPMHQVNDVCYNPTRSRPFLESLKRAGRVQGVIEGVANAARFRVFVPRESALISFALSNVRAPYPPRTDRDKQPLEGDPCGPEGLRFSRMRYLNRAVELRIETLDRSGTFLGDMECQSEPVRETLLREGYARIYGARATASDREEQAQANAREAKRGIWEFPEALQQAQSPEQETAKTAEEVLPNVRVADVIDGGACVIQTRVPDDTALTARINALTVAPPSGVPPKGTLVAVRCENGAVWRRARVEEFDFEQNTIDLTLVDIGYYVSAPISDLRPLEPEEAQAPHASMNCFLAFIVPPADEHSELAADELRRITEDKQYECRIVYRDERRRPYITLVDSEGNNVAVQLLRSGLALVDRNAPREHYRLTVPLREAQDQAKQEHLNIWMYGEALGQEEEEDAAPVRGGRGRRR